MRFRARDVLAGLAALGAVAATGATAGVAADARIEGAWSGGGNVVFASGDRERARCRASFSAQSAKTYRMHAVCATQSARVEQTATVRRVSADSFSGQFHNPEYNASGSIHITVHGSKLDASLRGDGGSASLRFTR